MKIYINTILFINALIMLVSFPVQKLSGSEKSLNKSDKTFSKGMLNPEAPPETEQFGQLAGIWDAEHVKRNRDGSWSDKKTKTEWHWYYILDGHAIQDDWISVEKHEESSSILIPVGTNIRIYNPEEAKWYMAWIDKNNRRLASFTATYKDDEIIMSGQNAQGRQIRNTFFNISRNNFDWKQE